MIKITISSDVKGVYPVVVGGIKPNPNNEEEFTSGKIAQAILEVTYAEKNRLRASLIDVEGNS